MTPYLPSEHDYKTANIYDDYSEVQARIADGRAGWADYQLAKYIRRCAYAEVELRWRDKEERGARDE